MNLVAFYKWVDIFAIGILLEGIFILIGKYTPFYAKYLLKDDILKHWRRIRFTSDLLVFIGFYLQTFAHNLEMALQLERIFVFGGFILIVTGFVGIIINNKKHLHMNRAS